jgi:hypothetical protein
MGRQTRYLLLATALLTASSFGATWRPIDPSEIAQKTPRVDRTADAEAIFWDVRIEDNATGGDLVLTLNHYIRIKIFTDRGKEEYSTVEIPRYGRRNISDIAGRTIKPDGAIVDMKKDAIFDRELVKTKGAKLRGKTFALPNVEVGDIIEYQYKETRNNEIASYMRLYFQREIPTWNVSYHLKPLQLAYLPYAMRSMAFQCQPTFQKEQNGWYVTSLASIPAFKSEPYMPPEDQLRSWLLIYYEEDKKIDADKFWKDLGKQDFARFKSLINPNGDIKKLAAEVTSGITEPAGKLAALDRFCRTRIRNVNSSASHATAEEDKAVKENHSPGDTLKQKAGRGMDIDYLFAALASAAGFDARMARIPDRGDTFFSPRRPTTYFIENVSVAVKAGDNWTFFDPATPYLEAGMLRWQEEGQQALISDPKEGFFAKTQYTPAERSKRQHRATFELKADGTLEGSVEYSYTGHEARTHQLEYEDMTPAQQEKDWKESIQGRLSTAEISDFSVTGLGAAGGPVTIKHKISVPGYATRTGKRILLQPAFFQRNISNRFPQSERKWDLYFESATAEDDEVTIDLPAGWELDQPVRPEGGNFGDAGSYTVEVRKTVDGRKLIYKRRFEWAKKGWLLVPVAEYPKVKNIFDMIHEQDAYTIALKAAADAN